MKTKLLCVLVLTLLAGCGTSTIVSRGGTRGLTPRIPMPARPVLSELTPGEVAEVKEKLTEGTRKKIMTNFRDLHEYSRQLEVSVEAYNQYARYNNALARQEIGLPPTREELTQPKVEEKKDE